MEIKEKRVPIALTGILTGFANGLFGSGGGTAAVPLLKKSGLEEKKAHATSLALTLPLSVISLILYQTDTPLPWRDIWPLLPAGLAGAALGSLLLKRISPQWLKRIFGGLLVASAVRLFWI